MKNFPLIFCAIDTPDQNRARVLADAAVPAGCGIKLGLEFFSAQGRQGVRTVMAGYPGAPLFLDLKFHDIPNTVAAAVRAVTGLAPAYINVHASGGPDMMRAAGIAAREESDRLGITAPLVLGVTVLTSLDARPDDVVRLAVSAKDAGLAGVVCSAHEIAVVRAACGGDFILMVPGIRPAGAEQNDQRRTMTPREALAAGATHLVIGRPITAAPDPAAAARSIIGDIQL